MNIVSKQIDGTVVAHVRTIELHKRLVCHTPQTCIKDAFYNARLNAHTSRVSIIYQLSRDVDSVVVIHMRLTRLSVEHV